MSSLSAEKAARAEPEMWRACIYSKSVLFQWLQAALISTINNRHIKAFAVQFPALHISRKLRLELHNLTWDCHFHNLQLERRRTEGLQFVGMGNTVPFSLRFRLGEEFSSP
uniref:PPUP942 n=1 Tax=Poeciliopsis prolifica TaxID=188132 RepID=A0A0S7EM67_9TELE